MDLSILRRATALLSLAVLGAFTLSGAARSDSPSAKDVSVSLCDGEGRMDIAGLRPGEILPRVQARALAEEMLKRWRKSQGEARWASWVRGAEATTEVAPQAPAGAPPEAAQPTKFTARDQMLWKLEQDKWIAEGYRFYHSPTDLGGTTGVSCDMCHPDGSNTHPETYPKYQAQLKKTALLRDMINWCIQNPEKGSPLPEGDARLRAVEAYILSARRGVPLDAGRH